MPGINIFENSSPILANTQVDSSTHLSAFLCGYSLYHKITQNDTQQLGYKIINSPTDLLSKFNIAVLSGASSGFTSGAGFSGGTVHDRELHSAINYLQYGGILVAATGATALNNTALAIDSVFCEDKAMMPHVINLVKLRQDCIGIVGSSAEYYNGTSASYNASSLAHYSMFGITGITGATSTDEYFFSIIGRKTIDRQYGNTGSIDILVGSDVAGLMARTDINGQFFLPPSGIRKGQINFYTNYEPKLSETDMNTLESTYGINSIAKLVGYNDSAFVMGDATLEQTDTDRMHVGIVRLITGIKRGIKPLLQGVLFEVNNQQTRERLFTACSAYLSRLVDIQGLSEFSVRCDSFNNTDEIVAAKQLVLDISFRPIYLIDSVTFRFVLNQG